MDRDRTIESGTPDLSNYMIDKEYLNITKHRQNLQLSRRCIYFYQKLNTQIEGYYHIIYSLPEQIRESLQISINEPNPLLLKFKTFLQNFFQIFALLANFQIEGLSKIRSSMYDSIDCNYNCFSTCIYSYKATQDQFQEDITSYQNLCSPLQKNYQEVQTILRKVEQNYNFKFIRAEYEHFTSELEKKEKLQAGINEKIEVISKNARNFQKEIMFYRQKLVSFKYQYIEKIHRLCNNSKQSLMEILTYMYDYVTQNKDLLAINKKDLVAKFDPKTIDRRDIREYIIKCTREYDEKITKYSNIISKLITIFTQIAKEMKQCKTRQNEITEQMKKYFQYSECNVLEVINTMDLYTLFLAFLSQIGDKLVYSQNNLLFLQKNINKSKEIALSILKCSKIDERKHSLQQKSFKEGDKSKSYEYLENLFEQMGEIYIQNILNKIYADFEETVIKIRHHFLLKLPVKKSISNSMSISYIEPLEKEVPKHPFKIDFWLWKDWRKSIDKIFVEFKQIKSLVADMGKYLQKTDFDDKQIEKLNCISLGKRSKGVLQLKPQGLSFQSIDNELQFRIPFYRIEGVDMELNIMSNNFKIETLQGILAFSDENMKEIKRFYVTVQRSLDFFNENNSEGKVVQNVVTITEQELESINNRKQQIQKELQNLNEYEHFNTIILEDVSISDTYRVIFSDNKLTIKGKEYQCFADFLMKKFNNFNSVSQKFFPIGPEFYTGVKGIDFSNCPLSSQRKLQYDHTLPKMPFIPESCHNSQTVKIYWISHEEFHVKETNITSGAPYIQNFYLTNITTVHKILQDVEIRFFIKVNIINDFSLKKVIIGKALDQAKWGSGIFAEEAKKVMLSYKRKNGKSSQKSEKLQQSNFSDKTEVKKFKSQIQSLEYKNKILIYILSAVFLANIIIKIFI